MVCRLGAGYRICAPGSRMALGGFFISGSVVGLQGLRCRGFLLDVPFGLCVRAADSFLVGPGYGLSWRVSCPRCAWVPLSECWGGRVVNSERGLSPVHGRPCFAKHSLHVGQWVEIAPVHPDLIAASAAVPDGFCWLVPQSDKRTA